MFKYKIVSDGPERRKRTSSFPEQRISQLQAKDVLTRMDLAAFEMEALTTQGAFDWFDTGETQTLKATDDCECE